MPSIPAFLRATARAAALALALGCAHGVPAPRPLPPPAERARGEEEACTQGTLPPWLDDAALDDATRQDTYDRNAFEPGDAYVPSSGSVYRAPLPPPHAADRSPDSSRTLALLAERQAFLERCQAMRQARGLKLMPARPKAKK